MILLDVIEYTDPSGQEIIKKVPENGAADIRLGAQLVVRETQSAVFYKDGKALDVFGPGRYTLTTNNLPVLSGLLNLFTRDNKTPFSAEVYFVNQKTFTDLKWGTPQPIDLKDAEFGWVQIRTFGTFSIKVIEPQLFINNLVGTQGVYSQSELNNFLKGSILANLNKLLADTFKSYGEIRKDLDAFTAAIKLRVKDDFDKYGIELRDFFVMDISVPEELQQALRSKSKMNILGVGNYAQLQTADAIGNMGKNPSGGGSMEMGAGMGMGMMMPQMIAQAMSQTPGQQQPAQNSPQNAQPAACIKCGQGMPQGSKFCPSCGSSQEASRCTNCNAALPTGAKFCADCGTKQP